MKNQAFKQYSYDGPVVEFGRCIAHRWHGTTYAVSERKARSNLVFRFKDENGKAPTASIKLPGKIVVVE